MSQDKDFEDVFNTDTPEDVAQKNAEARKNSGVKYFSLKDDETAVVRFLDDEPITFYQHRIKDPSLKEGLGGFRNLTCLQKAGKCPLCAAGDKPRYIGAYRLIHLDHKDGKKVVPTEKIFLKGINTIEVLLKKNRKKKLSSENLEVERTGEGFQTQWLFEWTGDTGKIKDYVEMENDDIRFLFKPNIEVMTRLAKRLKGSSKDDDGEDEEEPPKKSKKSSNAYEDEDIPF